MVAPSRISMKPRGVKSDHMLCEKTDPRPMSQTSPPANKVMCKRLLFSRSISRETTDSSMEMEVLSAANSTSKRKRVPTIMPPGICPKATGRVTNNKPGPEAGSNE